MTKIDKIKEAIEKADRFESKLSDEVKAVPFLGSLKNRALLNNLGELGTHYLEIGCHKGGSYCSAVFGNNNIFSATVIDSFESDHMSGETAKVEFLQNSKNFTPQETGFELIQSDCFKVNLSQIKQPIDFYLYDGSHSELDQYKALSYFLDSMDNEFIFCCDDYGWEEVKVGTQKAIKDLGLTVLFEKELVTEGEYSNQSWWTGFYVALLKKK